MGLYAWPPLRSIGYAAKDPETQEPVRRWHPLPRHPAPFAPIGGLVVDRSALGRNIGRLLTADAAKRVVAAGETVAMHALIVDSANDDAKRFYEGFGFLPLTGDPMRLFLTLAQAILQRSKG